MPADSPGTTQRLFVALSVPASTVAALGALQPQRAPGVRLTDPADMHITLHFLGQQDVGVIVRALSSVHAPSCTLMPSAAGSFSLGGGRHAIWVGIELSPELLAVHAATGNALEASGFEPEPRPWVPHITLARLGPQAPLGRR